MISKNRLDIFFFIFLVIAFLFVFNNFWKNPIYIWDEAIYAHNALEMAKSNNFFILTLNDEPNHYNTKPPLAIWLMAICIKIFGANEFALRLPSVIAFGLTVITLIRFSKKYFGDYYYGILGSVILLGAKGLMISHGARSGDLDSLLLLCSTLLCLNCIELCISSDSDKADNFIRKGFLYMAIGFFVKSTSIFLFIPGILICVIISKKSFFILTRRTFYVSLLILLFIITGYYIFKEQINPGYWEPVYTSEYKRVFSDVMPWHRQPFTWYFQNFFSKRFSPFSYFIVPAILVGFTLKKTLQKKLIMYMGVIFIAYLLTISLVPDKLEWYDLPVYPLFSFCLAVVFGEALQRFSQSLFIRRINYFQVFKIIFLFLFSLPIFRVVAVNKDQLIKHDLEREAYCLKKINNDFKDLSRLKILMNVDTSIHKLSCEFYIRTLSRAKNYVIVGRVSDIQKGDTVLYCQDKQADSLKNSFTRIDTIQKYTFGNLFKVQ